MRLLATACELQKARGTWSARQWPTDSGTGAQLECCIGVEPLQARPFLIKKDAVPPCLSAKASQAANQVASLPPCDLVRAVPTLVRLDAR